MNPTTNPESKLLTAFDGFSQGRATAGHSASDGNGDGSLDTILEATLAACLEVLHDSSAWRRQVTTALETIGRSTLANTEGLEAVTQVVARVEAAMQKEASATALSPADVARWETQLGQLSRASAAQTYNLEQVRLQAEALARNSEKLSQDVIQRQVMDPFFVKVARLYEAVYALSGHDNLGDHDFQPILQRIRGFLEDYNIELIHPDDGEAVDPRRHQPVKQLRSPDASRHGRIASTFNVGLVHGVRVVQPARVEVFIFADATPVNSENP
jgi:molecular chaperone GrpE